MKHFLIATAFALTFIGTAARAKTNVFDLLSVKTNFVLLYRKDLNLIAEFAVSENVTLGPYWINTHGSHKGQTWYGSTLVRDEIDTSSDHQFGVSLSFFPKSRRMDGSFVNMNAALSLGSVQFSDTGKVGTGSYTGYVVGFQAGYQWLWDFGLNLQLSAGAWIWGPAETEVTFANGEVVRKEIPGRFLGNWTPVVSVNVGYAI